MTFAIIWPLCAVASFALFIHVWRKDFDATYCNVAVFAVLSSLFGPMALMTGSFMWVVATIEHYDCPILWRRK